VKAVAMSSVHMEILIIVSRYVRHIFALSASLFERTSSQLNSAAKLRVAEPNDVVGFFLVVDDTASEMEGPAPRAMFGTLRRKVS
jgi:hypothetical protein